MNKKLAIYSVPRSGSSWFGEIINSSPFVNYCYQPLFSYAFKSQLTENSSKDDINDFFNNIRCSDDEFIRQKIDRNLGYKPNFKKEEEIFTVYKEVRYLNIIRNLLETDSEIKIIGIVRNPISVLNSWKNAPREFRKDLGWDFEQEWKSAKLKNEGRVEEFFGYDKWKEAALLFDDLHVEFPDRFLIVNYSDLVSNLNDTVCNVFGFLKLSVTEQTKIFLEATANKGQSGTYSVYNGKSDTSEDWKNQLPKHITEQIVSDCKSSNLTKYLK